MKADIAKIKKDFSGMARELGIKLALLFGSQTTGKTHKQSDVDIAILSETAISPLRLAQRAFAVAERLKIEKVELVDLRGVAPFLLKQIASKSILLYEAEAGLFNNFKIYSFKLYMEAKPLYDLREQSLHHYLNSLFDKQLIKIKMEDMQGSYL